MISIDYSLIIVILNFVLMLILLNKLLFKPLKQYLVKRQEEVQSNITEAKEKSKTANQLLKKREDELKESSEEIRQLTRKAKKEAEQKAEEILSAARQREKQIMIESEEQLEHQQAMVHKKIEKELAGMVSQLTAKLLDKKLDSAQDKELINSVIKEGE